MTHSLDNIRATAQASSNQLLQKHNVIATGIGYKYTAGQRTDTLCIVCSVEKKVSISELEREDRVPPEIDGLPTDVVETGPIRAFQSTTGRFRPAPGGVSIGHRDITAGTLGCVVRRDGQLYILSNNHVLANSNDGSIGDPILQPGPHDGGRLPDDKLAVLSDFVPIKFEGAPSSCGVAGAVVGAANTLAGWFGSDTRLKAVSVQAEANKVDAAIARPLQDSDVSEEILHIGPIKGVAQGELGMAVKKCGRTTGFTQGEIQQIDVTVKVQYGGGRVALFSDQLLAGAMSQGGDSGSAVLDDSDRLVGLLFAGSDNSTIINRIENVFSSLNLSL